MTFPIRQIAPLIVLVIIAQAGASPLFMAGIPGFSQGEIENKVAYLDQYFLRIEDEEKSLRSFDRQCI